VTGEWTTPASASRAAQAPSSPLSATVNARWSKPTRVSSNASWLPCRCWVSPSRACRPSCLRNTLRRVPSSALNSPARRKPSTSSYQAALASTSRTVNPKWWIPLIMLLLTVSFVPAANRGRLALNQSPGTHGPVYRSTISSRCRTPPAPWDGSWSDSRHVQTSARPGTGSRADRRARPSYPQDRARRPSLAARQAEIPDPLSACGKLSGMDNPRDDSPEAKEPGRKELQRNLDSMEQVLFDETRKLTSVWRIGIGRFSTYRIIGSGELSFIYFTLAGCCLVAGIVLTLYGTVAQNVGVALIVGSIFSIGSFAAQVWTVTAQQERSVSERVQGVDPHIAALQEMHKEIIRLSDQIKNMPPDT
jgi:hypothetical protein